ncbi:hypothetical protein MED217_06841 [Leeuwenhoekiella blandensis MED217]|uniref:TonB-dependent receptor n=4 Tax=Leeuwenhoekiella TaxID=283735 RepID=A3XMX0_LEEBM|nr:hypothetical protein MED217_06841 [Leeuwenhoekiella blandensis MED217]
MLHQEAIENKNYIMKLNYKNIFSLLFVVLGVVSIQAQEEEKLATQDSVAIQQDVVKDGNAKESGNRNVMLNAESNTGPREVNIGLPPSIGGITILENNLPVVYWFWPEMSTGTWRQSVGLERTGLLKMDGLANTMGDLGFAVNSYTQKGTKEFKGKAKLSGSHFGWFQGDINVSGPISESGWSYSAGAFVNFDPSTYDLGFNNYADQTQIYRIGLTKHFKENKGDITFAYKYSNSYSLTNYAVFEYGPNGEARELDDFTIGRDSYLPRDGRLKFLDMVSGDNYWADMDGQSATSEAHNFDIFGNYLMDNGWNFKYSTRLHIAEASLMYSAPISIFNAGAGSNFTFADTGEAYTGQVGTQLAMNSPRIPTTTLMGRFSVEKQLGNHDLTFGMLEQYYTVDDYHSNRSFFFQSVEPQPRRLIGTNTDVDGFYNYNVGGEYNNGFENKLSIYGSDSWKVSDRLKLDYGLHLRYHKMKGDHYTTPRAAGLVLDEANKQQFDHDWFHVAGKFNATYNVLNNFGILGSFLYTEENGLLGDYSGAPYPNLTKSKSPLGGLGVFWNTDYIQLVSQATYLNKNNYLQRLNLVNPNDDTESVTNTIYYDIQTIGWTTDFVLKPFKGFNLHYLITLQDPVYKKFNFTAFDNEYDYNDNSVQQISKVLMEIDPSYTYKDWRFWASFRYFSKQYANLTNALYFAERWETFGGINYKYNEHISLGATVVNFLNQRGAKGTINGAELITEPDPYYGRLLTGSYIRPFTVQASVTINF